MATAEKERAPAATHTATYRRLFVPFGGCVGVLVGNGAAGKTGDMVGIGDQVACGVEVERMLDCRVAGCICFTVMFATLVAETTLFQSVANWMS